MMARGVRRWAGLLLVGLALAGCSDDPEGPGPDGTDVAPTEPTGPTTSAPDPTESASEPAPGPTSWPEPTRPAAMERDDVEGAKAAAEYFLELYPYVYATGDLSSWHEISHPECQFCAGVVENVEDLHADGGYAEGPVVEVIAIEAEPPDEEYEYFSVWIDAEEGQSTRYDESGGIVTQVEASLIQVDFALAWSDGKWIVRGAVGKEPDEHDREI